MSSGRVRPRETFSRDDRLRKRREFEECYATGVRVSGPRLQLFLLLPPAGRPPSAPDAPATTLPRPRLGISVPRRVGKAVARNRVRRRIREIFRRNRDLFGTSGPSIVVNARPAAAAATFSELTEEYRALVAKTLSRGAEKPRR